MTQMSKGLTIIHEQRLGISYTQPASADEEVPPRFQVFEYMAHRRWRANRVKCLVATETFQQAFALVGFWNNEEWSYYGVKLASAEAKVQLTKGELVELEHYRKLHDGLSDMIEGGRLTKADIPNDYEWLVRKLERVPSDTSARPDRKKGK